MKTKLFIGMTVLMLLVSACGIAPVFGSGKVVTGTRDVSGFDKVSVSGGGELVIIQDGTESVTVETDDNLMQYVVAEVRGGTLNLSLDNNGMSNFSPTHLVFTVHVKNLTGVTTSGAWDFIAAEIDTDNLDILVSGTGIVDIGTLTADSLTVNFSGTGELDAAGQVTSLSLTISGTGDVRAADLKSETAEIQISGTGDVLLWVTGSLTVDISGTGTVQYYGNPQMNINTSGTGDVQRLGDK
jgi:hypothetical protein